MKRHHLTLGDLDEKAKARFWSRVHNVGSDGCWEWFGQTRNSHGYEYGVVRVGSAWVYAHRVAYLLANGSIDPELTIDHSYAKGCRSKLCMNPSHLEQVTQSENVLRVFRDPERLYSLQYGACGHARVFDRYICPKCQVRRVAASQAKKPEYYREMKRLQKRREREAKANG